MPASPLNMLGKYYGLPDDILLAFKTGFNPDEMTLLQRAVTGDLNSEDLELPVVKKLVARRLLSCQDGKINPAELHTFIHKYILYYRNSITQKSYPAFKEFFSHGISQHNVITYSRVKQLLTNAPGYWVIDCVCRVLKTGCPHPQPICMGLVKNYDYDAVRKITCQDALEIAEDAERRNLVPTYIPMEGDENWLCFCCKCCCIPIEQFIACGKSMLPSDFVQFTDEDACIACGDCLPACQFSARILENDKLLIQEPRCLGCGVCIDDCPQDAISLISRI